jgi:predicted DNA-binding transcriptional regulator YafY
MWIRGRSLSRAQRLLDLIQILRRHRRPVTGAALAQEQGVSPRTLYRDIASLQAQGADIAGEAGLGYLLRPGFTLPPLMFNVEEIEALALGSRWVAKRTDSPLADSARNALAKIAAVLPRDLSDLLDSSTLLVGPGDSIAAGDAGLPTIRAAIRAERKLILAYVDKAGIETRRTIWPVALGFFDRARVVIAWCETRAAFRHFRTDRIRAIETTQNRYPRRRQALMKEWRTAEGIADG